ncbi:quinoprotein dehydrogenase-associated putative ABC transporter substrate-binding protein [Methyloligella sp. GL2]|nr:quinoprotein dehydrogenase-associated putative ABC transporter substrate-binding protein [Methyloligella sp. GL2]
MGAVFTAAPEAASARELRVCADPNNLPYSKKDGSGFENEIAEIIADELGAKLSYYWFPERRTFLRNTIKAGHCDVVMGIPSAMKMLLTTRPYYRSSYAFVQREGEAPVTSFDDPKLRKMKIGVQLLGEDGVNSPPVEILARRGIVGNVEGYMVYGDYGSDAPLSPIMDAVADGDVDVAIVWGPIAGYFASREDPPLQLTPVLFDPSQILMQMTYDMSIGVRKGDTALAGDIGDALRARRDEIDAVLARYGVPRVDKPTKLGEAR